MQPTDSPESVGCFFCLVYRLMGTVYSRKFLAPQGTGRVAEPAEAAIRSCLVTNAGMKRLLLDQTGIDLQMTQTAYRNRTALDKAGLMNEAASRQGLRHQIDQNPRNKEWQSKQQECCPEQLAGSPTDSQSETSIQPLLAESLASQPTEPDCEQD